MAMSSVFVVSNSLRLRTFTSRADDDCTHPAPTSSERPPANRLTPDRQHDADRSEGDHAPRSRGRLRDGRARSSVRTRPRTRTATAITTHHGTTAGMASITITAITSDSSDACFGSWLVFASPGGGVQRPCSPTSSATSLPDAAWVPWVCSRAGHGHVRLSVARPFLTGAVSEVRSRKPGMMLLIALAITVAFFASMGSEPGNLLDHELELLVGTRPAGGHHAARPLDRDALAGPDHLGAGLSGSTASRRGREGRRRRRDHGRPADLAGRRCGDRPARSSRSPPTAGSSTDAPSMDESMVTGESGPVPAASGTTWSAGTVATDSGLRVEVTAIGDDTALAGIQAPGHRCPGIRPPVPSASPTPPRLAVLVRPGRRRDHRRWSWSLVGDPDTAVVRTITVLVIACPHALGWPSRWWSPSPPNAPPAAASSSRTASPSKAMRTVDAVLFDKTGTLTKGEPTVTASRRRRRATRTPCSRWPPPPRPTASTPWHGPSSKAAEERGLGTVPRTPPTSRSSPAAVSRRPVDGTTALEVGGRRLLGKPSAPR
jgi:Cu2+-exporting ATPase